MNTTKTLNILHIASWYPSKVHATLGNFVQRHIQAISSIHQCTVLYLTKRPDQKEDYVIEERKNGDVLEIICYYKHKGILGTGYLKAFSHVLKQLLEPKMKAFDLVHVHVLFRAGLLALQCQKKYQLPFVITEHWTGYHINDGKSIGFIQRLLSQRIAKRASVIAPVSEHLGSAMKAFGLESHYEVVANVVDHTLFVTGEKGAPFTFIHVSSLVDDHKNISGILRAFSNVHSQINVNLLIVGDGDTEPYKKLASQLSIPESRITILGEQPISEVAKLMGSSHGLVLFSNYENQPCVISEAHAAGMPIIATDVGGINEHLSEKHGILIQKQDEVGLERAMIELFENYSNYDQEFLREYSLNHFSIEAIAGGYSNIYQKVI